MAAISVNDGGTWRTPYAIYVNDGGTWRTIQQIYVNDGGTWRTVFLFERLNATLTEGTGFDGVANFAYGYDSGGYSGSFGAYGSISSPSLSGGGTVVALYDLDTGFSGISIAIGSDPGINYIGSLTVGGVTKTGATASYFYSGGIASWAWASLFGLDGIGTSTVVITP